MLKHSLLLAGALAIGFTQGCMSDDEQPDTRVTTRTRSGPNTIAGSAQSASDIQAAQGAPGAQPTLNNGPGGVRGDYAGSVTPFGGVTGPDANPAAQRGDVGRLGLPSGSTPTGAASQNGAADRAGASSAVDSAGNNNGNDAGSPAANDTTFTGPRGGNTGGATPGPQAGGSSGAQGGSNAGSGASNSGGAAGNGGAGGASGAAGGGAGGGGGGGGR